MTSESEPQATYDRRGLDGVCNGNELLRRRILAEYARTSAAQVDQLLGSLSCGDIEGAERIAHTLKGSSRTIGAFALGALCEHIELGRNSANSEVGPTRIREEFERVQKAVQSHLEVIS